MTRQTAASVMDVPALPGRAGPRPRTLRRASWWALLVLVLLGHALAGLWLQDSLVGWGEGEAPMPPRMEVSFVQELAPTAAPSPPPAPAARLRKKPARARSAAAAASAASAALAETAAPLVEAPSVMAVPVIEAVAAPPLVASEPDAAKAVGDVAAAAAADAAASAPAAFEWPPSTRLNYRLSGNYRGELHGSARVQWVRQGARYQVHLDVLIGPSFAPLIWRRMTSDGELGEQGLVPQRYDEATRLPFQRARRISLQFTPEQVTLANGSQHESLPGVQDSASQFVQLTWMFTTRPELLRAGNTVTIALALPRRVGRWVYDVLGEERLSTPMGELDTFHLKPRLGERRPGNELSAEVWFAPTLQYLPVRIRIQQDPETFVDMVLDGAPMQAAPEAGASGPG